MLRAIEMIYKSEIIRITRLLLFVAEYSFLALKNIKLFTIKPKIVNASSSGILSPAIISKLETDHPPDISLGAMTCEIYPAMAMKGAERRMQNHHRMLKNQ